MGLGQNKKIGFKEIVHEITLDAKIIAMDCSFKTRLGYSCCNIVYACFRCANR